MKVKYSNSFKSKALQYDKAEFVLRISALTILALKGDWSKKSLELTLLNLKFEIKF